MTGSRRPGGPRTRTRALVPLLLAPVLVVTACSTGAGETDTPRDSTHRWVVDPTGAPPGERVLIATDPATSDDVAWSFDPTGGRIWRDGGRGWETVDTAELPPAPWMSVDATADRVAVVALDGDGGTAPLTLGIGGTTGPALSIELAAPVIDGVVVSVADAVVALDHTDGAVVAASLSARRAAATPDHPATTTTGPGTTTTGTTTTTTGPGTTTTGTTTTGTTGPAPGDPAYPTAPTHPPPSYPTTPTTTSPPVTYPTSGGGTAPPASTPAPPGTTPSAGTTPVAPPRDPRFDLLRALGIDTTADRTPPERVPVLWDPTHDAPSPVPITAEIGTVGGRVVAARPLGDGWLVVVDDEGLRTALLGPATGPWSTVAAGPVPPSPGGPGCTADSDGTTAVVVIGSGVGVADADGTSRTVTVALPGPPLCPGVGPAGILVGGTGGLVAVEGPEFDADPVTGIDAVAVGARSAIVVGDGGARAWTGLLDLVPAPATPDPPTDADAPGGGTQLLVLAALIAAVGFIGWRIFGGTRRGGVTRG